MIIQPLPLERVGPGGDLREAFLAVQEPWQDRGLVRWIDLVRPDGRWPVEVVGAWPEGRPEALSGTIVCVWAPEVLSRFDDLLEGSGPDGVRGDSRPTDGAWHLIAVTTVPETRGTGLGRRLARGALRVLGDRDPTTTVCTLSPAVGLADLAEQVPGESFEERVRAVLWRVSDDEGRPVLRIQRFHLGNGATLGAVLFDSRRDDASSGCVTLRFDYSLDPAEQRANLGSFRRWVEDRRRRLRAGEGRSLSRREGALLLADT
ncbi:MAG: hypothetical protein ACQEXJ_16580 [Myxococcota bacterium]